MFLGKKCKFMDTWCRFLQEKKANKSLIVVPKDVWDMFYELVKSTKGDLKNFEDDGAWPTLFDEFVNFK